MSEATAVVETETLTPTQETPPPAPVEETPAAPVSEAPAAAEPEIEITADNLDDLPEWKAIGTAKDATKDEAAADDLPGESYEDVEARNDAVRAQRYSRIMQANDAGFKAWATQQGYSAEEATGLWQQLSPMLRAVHQDNEAHNRALFNYSVGRALPKEDAETFYGRSYRSQAEALQAVYELGKKASAAEFEGKTTKGEYITRQQAQAIRDAAFNRGRGLREAGDPNSGATSGASVRGAAVNDSRSDDAKLLDPATPVKEVEAILARRGM